MYFNVHLLFLGEKWQNTRILLLNTFHYLTEQMFSMLSQPKTPNKIENRPETPPPHVCPLE